MILAPIDIVRTIMEFNTNKDKKMQVWKTKIFDNYEADNLNWRGYRSKRVSDICHKQYLY